LSKVLNVGAWHNAPLMTGTHAVPRGDLELGDQEDAAGESPPREQQVRAAALRLFRDKGYHATSMRDIAAEVGINKGSLYSYIRSKEDLLIPFFERAMGLLLAEIEAISADETLTATERLKRAIKAHILNVTENLDILTVYLSEWRQLRADSLSTVRQQRERYAALFLTIVQAGVNRGEFRAIDPRISTLGMIGMCNYLFRWYRPDGRLRPEQIADELTDMLLHGVLA
jgi:TetR/AcrR family transcriptional regulator, cholesterol catabolism regulator